MNTQEVADKLVQWCREGKYQEAYNLYDDNAISKEMPGFPNAVTEGKQAIVNGFEQWQNSIEETHGGEISEPMVAGNHFTIRMTMDATFKDQGRVQMDEICLYKVENGKIMEAQYFYEMPPQE